jgi:hypothetical protein
MSILFSGRMVSLSGNNTTVQFRQLNIVIVTVISILYC